MKEAQPAKIKPPGNREPALRVGIVLKEDHKQTLIFKTRDKDWRLSGGGEQIALPANHSYEIRNKGGRLELRTPTGEIQNQSDTLFTLSPALPQKLSRGAGLEVSDITVGRGFHWQKKMTETIAGSFEVRADGDDIVLVNLIGFEDYLTCVLSSEIGGACPAEFCKAQIVAARSWAMVFLGHKHTNSPYTICNDDDCQPYHGTGDLNQTALDAVKGCRGEFLVDGEGFVTPAYYSKCCGGHTEKPELSFGFAVPSLDGRFDCAPNKTPGLNLTRDGDFTRWAEGRVWQNSGAFCLAEELKDEELSKLLTGVDAGDRRFRWEYTLSAKDLITSLRDKFGLSGIREIIDLMPAERGVSGRITAMTIVYKEGEERRRSFLLEDQYNIRRALHKSFLYSSAFNFAVKRGANGAIEQINFRGCGWGHGVGLCQIGALVMALRGHTYPAILKHYYPGAVLATGYA